MDSPGRTEFRQISDGRTDGYFRRNSGKFRTVHFRQNVAQISAKLNERTDGRKFRRISAVRSAGGAIHSKFRLIAVLGSFLTKYFSKFPFFSEIYGIWAEWVAGSAVKKYVGGISPRQKCNVVTTLKLRKVLATFTRFVKMINKFRNCRLIYNHDI